MNGIFIKGLCVHARHGLGDEVPDQRFEIDLEIELDLSACSRTDHLPDTICYSEVAKVMTGAFKSSKHCLLESAASSVIDALLERFPPIDAIKMTIHNFRAPIQAIVGDLGITKYVKRSSFDQFAHSIGAE
jgi:dihydroneopterin aldolase